VLARLREAEAAVDWSVGLSGWLPGEDLGSCLARADRSLYGVTQTRADTSQSVDAGRAHSLLPST
jgi:hypothetical protein